MTTNGSAILWEIIDHACVHCMGRLLQRIDASDMVVVRCAECGETETQSHERLCWCSVEVRGKRDVFECFLNLEVTPEVPQEILVRETPVKPL